MNKTMLTTGLAIGLFCMHSSIAEAGDINPTGVYLGANVGVDFYNDDDLNEFDNGGSLGVQLGYRWNDHFRTELELSGSAAEIDDTANNILGYGRLTLGAYYDFLPTSERIVPYAGAGVGTATVVVDNGNDDEDDGGLWSWHGEAGLALNINEHFALVPSYRYTWVEDKTDLLEDDLTNHAVRLGARLSF